MESHMYRGIYISGRLGGGEGIHSLVKVGDLSLHVGYNLVFFGVVVGVTLIYLIVVVDNKIWGA